MPTSDNPTQNTSERYAMLRTMAEMQDSHNTLVHPQWRSQGYEYYRAMWVECAEMLDHFGWKWWKKQDADLDQVRLELVDIWHFALSELLRQGDVSDDVADALASVTPLASATDEDQAGAFRLAIEELAGSCLRTRSFELQPFIDAMAALPMTLEELFDLYIGKNVLNRFRQNHGYKTGEYRKLWGGREDNEHLIDLLSELEVSAADLPDALYAALQVRYDA
ncbi:dUTP diphosphatase [Pseudomonadales bacterium]|jgi:dimeric dUTPase (all-alpha-NTP-PPase superfamily)|nr:dUTP diphosphatase [Pseudomonadales bacterium]MDG1702886.1 dUTP diphosphatase [Pseudomonadales bacterium]